MMSLAMTFYSVSIMTVGNFCKKLILFKQAGIIVSYICYITIVESDYFLWGKKPTKKLYQKGYLQMCK